MDETEAIRVHIVEMPDRSGQDLRNKIIIAVVTVGFTCIGAIWTEKKKIKMAKEAGVELVKPEYRQKQD